MATALTVTNIDQTLNRFLIEGTIALSGDYGSDSSHGDALDFATLAIPSNSVPTFVEIIEAPPAGTAPTGYMFGFAPGTTQANGQLTIFNDLAEYTEGEAYSDGLTGATIIFRAEFPAFV